MEITKEQIIELAKIAKAINDENRIDDDRTGGYIEEPYNSITERIYAVINECEGKNVDASENTLPIQNVVGSASNNLINPNICPFRVNGFCTA